MLERLLVVNKIFHFGFLKKYITEIIGDTIDEFRLVI